jgi:D-serine deaminase-like pyridoxal phosphate-dependent protein
MIHVVLAAGALTVSALLINRSSGKLARIEAHRRARGLDVPSAPQSTEPVSSSTPAEDMKSRANDQQGIEAVKAQEPPGATGVDATG